MTQTTDVWINIAGALNTHLDSTPGIPVVSGKKQVAWANTGFEPNAKVIYLAPRLLPGQTIAATIGVDGTNRPIGIYRVGVVAPLNQGTQNAMVMADAVADHFVRGTTLTLNGIKVHITTSEITPISTDTNFVVNVSIRWFSYGEL